MWKYDTRAARASPHTRRSLVAQAFDGYWQGRRGVSRQSKWCKPSERKRFGNSPRRCGSTANRALQADKIGLHVHFFGPYLDIEHVGEINCIFTVDTTEAMRGPINDHPFGICLGGRSATFQFTEMECFAEALSSSV